KRGKIRPRSIPIARKLVVAVFPDGLMHVHTRAGLAYDRLWHESRRFPVDVSNVMHRVFHNLVPVGAFDQSTKTRADFHLTRAANFMMVNFDGNTLLLEQQAHFGTKVVKGVNRRNRNVPALFARTMPLVTPVQTQTA